MNKSINLYGVKTNNLKSINVKFELNSITTVTGVSGGGKSSLAYNSLYEKCKQEFLSIESGCYDGVNYEIAHSENIIPAVAIKQKNSNINPRSTIYSYLNFPSLLSSLIFSNKIKLDISLLKITSPNLQCKKCEGIGEVFGVSLSKLINPKLKIQDLSLIHI